MDKSTAQTGTLPGRLSCRVEKYLRPVAAELEAINGLPDMFLRCFLSTLESTCRMAKNGETYIITGDIEAMWLRDSTEQVLHYLRFAGEDEMLAGWIEKLIARQISYILIDPYANAFNEGPNGRHGYRDYPPAGDWVWERKYELDSLCHVILLAWKYHEKTGGKAFMDQRFFLAMEKIMDVIETEREHEERSAYRFERLHCPPSDTLIRAGKGSLTGYTGMSWSGFRPSDDACVYGFFIPGNLFAWAMLERLADMADTAGRSAAAVRARALAAGLRRGVERFGIVRSDEFGEIYAYETDGLGHHLLMDDANIPSLLSLPYLGVCEADDPLYLRTRAFVLSRENAQFFSGTAARGVGSSHTPKGYIWPIGLCVQGLTSVSLEERSEVLGMLLRTHADTCRMHESFDGNHPEAYTRSWFAWADSMFGELIMRIYERGELPGVLQCLRDKGIKDIKKREILT